MRAKRLRYLFAGGVATLVLSGCATTPPSQMDDLCGIFREKPDWYEAGVAMQEKWGTPIQIAMAFIRYESAFRDDALPPKDYLLGFIPFGRVSSAYGYAQALDASWRHFEDDTDSSADRDDFEDSLMFIGWYTARVHRILGISMWDPYNQYLAYHEGITGYRNKTYRYRPKVMSLARKVEQRAKDYGWQLKKCRAELNNQ